MPGEPRRANRLLQEKSPYLLQHAYNPVDWFPWGEEAFAKAKREDKPVLLSVGYSTCYWCHVMEQESFANPEIASLMNALVVPIKVDREERPDIDAIYMAAVQAMSGSGGWPMTVFLTPEGKPFWGGTYLPPEDRWGRPGLPTVLRSIAEAWRTKRGEVLEASEALTQHIQASPQGDAGAALTEDVLTDAARQIGAEYDDAFGGFGPAPKFPRAHSLSFLLRVWSRTKEPRLLEMVESTLQAMARGGLHDQLGGGFHRYSTDRQWLVPHFEKMLYDQALLARAALEAFQVTGHPAYAELARDVFEYVLRDLRDPGGAFYSAEDAGEVGQEGEFYVFRPEEIDAALGADEAKLFKTFYGVTAEGNFERGQSILHVAQPLEAMAASFGVSADDARARLAAARGTLLAARGRRQRPHRDEKILTDWNGLMIAALAYGARVLEEPRYAEAARQAGDFLLQHVRGRGELLHRYRDGQAGIPGFLDDYAFLAWGLTDLYEATLDARWLAEAKRLTSEMVRLFWDEERGGFFLSGELNERLIAKTRELYDGALPSGNSVAALNLVRLGQLTMDKPLQTRAQRLFEAFSGQVAQAPHAFPQFLIALDRWLGPSQEIVIAGDPAAADTRAMLQAVHQRFLPRAVLVLHPTGEAASAIEALVPFVETQQPQGGKATAYVCENYLCNLPTTELSTLIALLDEKAPGTF